MSNDIIAGYKDTIETHNKKVIRDLRMGYLIDAQTAVAC